MTDRLHKGLVRKEAALEDADPLGGALVADEVGGKGAVENYPLRARVQRPVAPCARGAAAIVGTVLNLGLCHGDAADGTAGWARRSLRAILFMHAPIGHHTAAHLCPHAPRRPGPGPGPGPASMAALGHALLLAAMALLWATHAAMGASWTPFIAVKRGHRLVTWGPFAHVRHPMYTSACLLAAGFAAALGSVAVALAWVPGADHVHASRKENR